MTAFSRSHISIYGSLESEKIAKKTKLKEEKWSHRIRMDIYRILKSKLIKNLAKRRKQSFLSQFVDIEAQRLRLYSSKNLWTCYENLCVGVLSLIDHLVVGIFWTLHCPHRLIIILISGFPHIGFKIDFIVKANRIPQSTRSKKMKLFQFFRKFCMLMGILPIPANQNHVFNWKILLPFLCNFSISSIIYL